MRALILAAMVAMAACGPREPRQRELRMISPTYNFTIIPSQAPPHAREAILYKVVIRDRGTRPHVLRSAWRHETQRQGGRRTLHLRRSTDGPDGREPSRSQREAFLRDAASNRGAAAHVGSGVLMTAGNREVGIGKRSGS